MDPPELLRVGYWWSEKKTKKFNVSEFAKHCRENGLELVKLNLEQPLEQQGPFSAIVHKLSDLLVKADLGDPQAKQICQHFQAYVNAHPEMVVIDPVDNVRKLLDRYKQYQLVQESPFGLNDYVFTPAFVELTTNNIKINAQKLKDANVPFPIVVKPLLAHGTSLAHQMTLVFCESGLRDIVPPCVAQTFICHSAILYKTFIIGKNFYVIERPSLKNFRAKEHPSIFFDSHDISKPHSASPLNQLDAEDSSCGKMVPDPERLKWIAQVLQKELGLGLLGIDVILDSHTGRYAIIDMNTFPGYEGVDNVWQAMCDLIVDQIKVHKLKASPNSPSNCSKAFDTATEDSGIDTSDSCDEKKKIVRAVRRQHSRANNLPTVTPPVRMPM